MVAAAVILKEPIKALNDSKKLSKNKRNILKVEILEKALAYHIVSIGPRRIEKINILNASIEAMQQCILSLNKKPSIALIDGNRFKPIPNIPHATIVKGDGKYQCIAAASILAKTYRDELMQNLSLEYPKYGWESNAGYPTQKHRNAIQEFGISIHHRKTFQLLPKQLKLL